MNKALNRGLILDLPSFILWACLTLSTFCQYTERSRYRVCNIILKDDNTIGNFEQCHLLYVLSMIIKSDFLYTKVHLYRSVLCTDVAAMCMYPYLLLYAHCAMCH